MKSIPTIRQSPLVLTGFLVFLMGVIWLVLTTDRKDSRPAAQAQRHEEPTSIRIQKSTRDGDGITVKGREKGVAGIEIRKQIEDFLRESEAKRSRLLSQKVTEESDISLFGVEPPAPEEAAALQSALGNILREARAADRKELEQWLDSKVEEYDPFGRHGRKLLLIDIPNEPNGRVSGFTYQASDFEGEIRRFQDGEMHDLQNQRGYYASTAGLPVDRFKAFVVYEE